jgi:hypothetical protein
LLKTHACWTAFVENSYTAVHENLTKGLATDIRSQMDEQTDDVFAYGIQRMPKIV